MKDGTEGMTEHGRRRRMEMQEGKESEGTKTDGGDEGE